MSSLSQFGNGLKKVQRYQFTMPFSALTTTVTLSSAVNMDKTHISLTGLSTTAADPTNSAMSVRAVLTNPTTVTLNRGVNGGIAIVGEIEVIEFY